MSDNFNASAELEVRLEGIRELLNDLENAKDGIADLDTIQAKWTDRLKSTKREIAGVERELKKTTTAAKGAKGDLGVDRSDLSEWDELSDKIKRAELEYKSLARESIASGKTAPRASEFLADQGLSAADLKKYQAGNSISLIDEAGLNGVQAALPRLRYALYDVTTTAGVASAAITGVGVAATAAFASMESSFTNVERTLDGVTDPAKVQALRQELVGLTREIPLTFGNISEIATLGNQLGIESENIAKFTETTAKFSAVTGLTAEASAQAFGSLGELLNVQSRDYEAMGSSIALVGRKSVATEAEIVSMTQRLAASATNAGFTAQQVVALSGAFASLRVAPERAQGVMEVYFNRLNTAIAEGGPALEAFARTAGITTSEVESLVRTDPTAFFTKFVTGLGQMDSIAQTGALEQLGLSGIRAGEVFGRISGNVEVFNQALRDANQGWTEGTELGDQYAKVVDDLASRWQIFLNAVQEAGAAVGATLAPAITVVLSLLTQMAQGFAAIASHPVGAFVIAVAAGIATLGAAFLAAVAGGALFLASAAAMKTAMAELTAGGAIAGLTLRGLGGAVTQVGVAMGFSTGAIKAFKVALTSTGIGIAVLAFGALAAGIWEAKQAAGGFSEEAKQLGEALNRAIDQDTATWDKTGEAIATTTRNLKDSAPAADSAAQAAARYAGVQADTAAGVDEATKKIEEQTIALGKNADALFRKKLADDEGFSTVANDAQLRADAERIGLDIDRLITESLSKANGAATYLESIRAKVTAIREGLPEDQFDWTAADQKAAAYADRLDNILGLLNPVASELDQGRAAALEQGNAMEYAGVAAEGAAGGIGSAGDASEAAAEKMWASQEAAINMEEALYRLGSSIGENAGIWDIYSEAGRQNLTALYAVLDAIAAETPGNTSAIASNFQALYDALISGGFATAQQLTFLQQKIADLAGQAAATFSAQQIAAHSVLNPIGAIGMTLTNVSNGAVKPATRNFTSLFNGIQTGSAKAAKALGGGGGGGGGKGSVSKAVRTLLDYARDLEGVFKRAFDIRYGNQQGLDEITSGWRKIADAAQKARDEAAEHRRELASLAADRSIKQYWLSVAENYGDELRAAKLRAELAEIDADRADKQKELTEAQAEQNKTLTGNSDAAIKNRSDILDLLGSYQDLLGTYAANGMSQEQLKRKAAQLKEEFIRQAVQLGYSRTEVMKYARSFNDMALAIQRVPRNITVKANTNPALQALNEFEAKARAAGAKAGKAFSGGFGGAGGGISGAMRKQARGMLLMAEIAVLQMRIMRNALDLSAYARLAVAVSKLNTGNYWTGGFVGEGYTGDGGKYEPKGVVHGGEFVFSKAATRTIGVNNLAYMHAMAKRGQTPAVPVAAGGGGGVTDLSAASIRALADVLSRTLTVVLPGGQLAGSIGSHNIASGFRGGA